MNRLNKRYLRWLAVVAVLAALVFGWQPISAATRRIVYQFRFNNGLLGYWSFNGPEVSGVTVTDKSGNGNTGTLTNGAKLVPGPIGQGISLDGSNDYVSIPHNAALKPSTYITLEAWVKPNAGSLAALREVYRKEDGTDRHLLSFQAPANCNGGGGTGGCISFGISTGGAYVELDVNIAAADWESDWHHLVAVYDGSNKYIYRDGVSIGSAGATGALGTSGTASSYIGSLDGGAEFFLGSIDEVRVYDRALAVGEIQEHHRQGAQTFRSRVNANQRNRNTSNLLVYHSYDGGSVSGTTVTDNGTAGNNGTLRNGAKIGAGLAGQGLILDGSNDYDEVADVAALEYTGGDMTISLWAFLNDAEESGFFISKPWNGNGQYNYYIRYYGSGTSPELFISGATGALLSATTLLAKSRWYHIAATVSSADEMKIYVNGVEENSTTHGIVSWTPPDGDANLPLAIGTLYPYGEGMSDLPTHAINGRLDEVRTYSRVLSAAEIAELYRSGAPELRSKISSVMKDRFTDGLMMHLGFNGGDISGSTVTDKSGQANNGTIATLNSTAKLKPGVVGQGVDFLGSGSPNVAVGDADSLDFGTGSFTVSMWGTYRDFTYPKAWFMIKKSVQCYNAGAGNQGWDIGHGYNANGISICYSDGVNLATNGSVTFDSGYQPADLQNNWVNLVAVFDKSANAVKFYVNGVKQTNEYDISTVTGTISSTAGVTIGTMYGWQSDGTVDEVKIFNQALTAAQIKEMYLAVKKY